LKQPVSDLPAIVIVLVLSCFKRSFKFYDFKVSQVSRRAHYLT